MLLKGVKTRLYPLSLSKKEGSRKSAINSVCRKKVIEAAWKSVKVDLSNFKSNQSTFKTLNIHNAIDFYVDKYAGKVEDKATIFSSISIQRLKESGEFGGYSHMAFWKSVVNGTHVDSGILSLLLPIASMELAVPAGESVDEFCFSSSGNTFTKFRSCMSAHVLEQISVVRMFIRNQGWPCTSPTDLTKFIALIKSEEVELAAVLKKNIDGEGSKKRKKVQQSLNFNRD